jgi:hypothetical protein
MKETISSAIALPVIDEAARAGTMFAKSEIEASESLEAYARVLTATPSYEHWNACRINWVNAYVSIKPQAKGNSADQAFRRFKARLLDAYGIDAPKATSEAAEKKAAERAKKAAELEARFAAYNDQDLTGMLQRAYEDAARNPMNKSPLLGELQRAVAQRTKARAAETRDELRAARERLFKLARECADYARIEAAADVLDPTNDVTIQ